MRETLPEEGRGFYTIPSSSTRDSGGSYDSQIGTQRVSTPPPFYQNNDVLGDPDSSTKTTLLATITFLIAVGAFSAIYRILMDDDDDA